MREYPYRVSWDTGRLYGAAGGQRMTALVTVHGWIAFYDRDRMIDGIVRGNANTSEDPERGRKSLGVSMSDADIRDRVMAAYDQNLYDYPREDKEYDAIAQAQQPEPWKVLCHNCSGTYEQRGLRPVQCGGCASEQITVLGGGMDPYPLHQS